MTKLKTLTPAVADILKTAPCLSLTVATSEEARRGRDPRGLHEWERRRAGSEIGPEVIRVADVETDYDDRLLAHRTEYRVFAMNEADLAILLTRAFEAGRRVK